MPCSTTRSRHACCSRTAPTAKSRRFPTRSARRICSCSRPSIRRANRPRIPHRPSRAGASCSTVCCTNNLCDVKKQKTPEADGFRCFTVTGHAGVFYKAKKQDACGHPAFLWWGWRGSNPRPLACEAQHYLFIKFVYILIFLRLISQLIATDSQLI